MKIDKSNVQDIISLIPIQEAILINYLSPRNGQQHFEQTVLEIDSEINFELFKDSLNHVAQQNEMLRVIYRWENLKKPLQLILKKPQFEIEYIDLSNIDDQEIKIEEILVTDRMKKFDFQTTPIRYKLLKCSNSKCLMVISSCSILYDGWSFKILLDEFFNVYGKLLENKIPEIKNKPKYKKFLSCFNEIEISKSKEYWKNYFSDIDEKADNFFNTKRDNSFNEQERYTLKLEKEITNNITEQSKNLGISISTYFYSVWGILLMKINNVNESVFGTVFSGRGTDTDNYNDVIGLFINTLPIRIKANNESNTIKDILLKVADDMNNHSKYEHTPLAKIVDFTGIKDFNKVFNTLLITEVLGIGDKSSDQDNIYYKLHSFEHASSYEITTFITNSSEGFEVHFSYFKNRIHESKIKLVVDIFKVLLNEFSKIDKKISQIDILSPEEKNKIVFQYNKTEKYFNNKISLKELFENQVRKTPANIALVLCKETITYRELNLKANQLARAIKESFVGNENKLVPILIDRSIEMIIGILGIIKAGFVYVPLEINLPEKRILRILNCISSKCIVTSRSNLKRVANLCENIPNIEKIFNLSYNSDVSTKKNVIDLNSIMNYESDNLLESPVPDDIAYVIYTSGTTGLPKGVMVKHKSAVNIIEWINTEFDVSETDRLLFVSSVGFDLSVYDIFGGLSSGASVHIVKNDELKEPKDVLNKLFDKKITIWNSAPAIFQQLLNTLELEEQLTKQSTFLRLLMLSGDWIPLKLPDIAKKYFPMAQVVSLGGATEATVWSNYYKISKIESDWNSIPYGKPIQNCKYYILDKDLIPMPMGIIGDLYISGICLADGYLNDPILTGKKFIENPFEPGEIMYHTGDLAKWQCDGNIELIGRKDSQIKIHGYRIELGEIEAQLLEIKDIQEALVICDKTSTGDNYIIAYIIAKNQINIDRIKTELSKTLPDYMLPTNIFQINEFPLTSNGKIDQARLPKNVEKGRIKLPTNLIEKKLLRLYSEILNLTEDKIGTDSNFFELGGHSLNVNILSKNIEKYLNTKMAISEIFNNPTIKKQAIVIADLGMNKNLQFQIKPAEKKEFYQLTSVQKRLYTLNSIYSESPVYNIAGGLEIEGILDIKKLKNAFNKIISTQESLRTYFKIVNGEVVQKIIPKENVKINIHVLERSDSDIFQQIHSVIKAFDLNKAPLIDVYLIKEDGNKSHLILNIHHIIFDGYSLKNLINDLMQAYRNEEINQPVLQYKDYSDWTKSTNYKNIIKEQEKYWLGQYSNKIQRLNLPLDYPRRSEMNLESDIILFKIENKLKKNLEMLAEESTSTMFIVQLTILNVLLLKICKQNDIIVGVPVINRQREEIDKTMGMFVNTLALRNFINEENTLLGLLKEITKNTITAFDNDSFPFELVTRIAEEIDKEVHHQNPVFDVALEYDNLNISKFELPNAKISLIDNLINLAKFDLTFEIRDYPDVLDCMIKYNESLFKKETIQWLVDRFMYIATQFADNPDLKISEIDILKISTSNASKEVSISFNF